MAKTITGLLVGIALSEGAIHSLNDVAATYVPELQGTEYGSTPIRALLHMSSGVAFSEVEYSLDEDIARLSGALLGPGAVGAVPALAETEVLGLVEPRGEDAAG
jgi:CubicO group peptidase (beta-lactamase class C family)